MIKVFIVDDHELIREGIKQIISQEADIVAVGEAGDGDEMMRKLSSVSCDIILLDLNLPGRNGIELIEDLKKRKVRSKILVLTINSEYRSAINAYKAGASGYINKDIVVNELVNSIRTVYKKGRYMDPEFAEQLAFNSLQEMKTSKPMLSSSELKFATMLNQGIDLKEIAEKTGISINAAILLRRKVFKKLNVDSYIQLVHYFKDQRIRVE